jgi:hypothetical protein
MEFKQQTEKLITAYKNTFNIDGRNAYLDLDGKIYDCINGYYFCYYMSEVGINSNRVHLDHYETAKRRGKKII